MIDYKSFNDYQLLEYFLLLVLCPVKPSDNKRLALAYVQQRNDVQQEILQRMRKE